MEFRVVGILEVLWLLGCRFGIHGSTDIILHFSLGLFELLDGLSKGTEEFRKLFGTKEQKDDEEYDGDFARTEIHGAKGIGLYLSWTIGNGDGFAN